MSIYLPIIYKQYQSLRVPLTARAVVAGLELILNINQDDYSPLTGDTAGIRLVVHPQERMPFPEDEGITVSPGHSTSIGMRQASGPPTERHTLHRLV